MVAVQSETDKPRTTPFTPLNMAGTASVAGEVFVDALPYFDQGYDAAGVREAVSRQRVRVRDGTSLANHATASCPTTKDTGLTARSKGYMTNV